MLFPFAVVVTIGAIGTVAVGSGGNVGTVGTIGSVGIAVHLLVAGAFVVLLSYASMAGSGSSGRLEKKLLAELGSLDFDVETVGIGTEGPVSGLFAGSGIGFGAASQYETLVGAVCAESEGFVFVAFGSGGLSGTLFGAAS